MRSTAIVLFVLAAIATMMAFFNVTQGENRPQASEDLVSYAVGSFLVPVILLIAGIVLWNKDKNPKPPSQKPPVQKPPLNPPRN